MPSLCGSARRPARGSELSLRVLSWHAVPCDPGEPDHRQFQSAMSAWPSPRINRLGTPNIPAIRFARGGDFRGYLVHTIVTVCKVARPPRTDQTDIRGGTPLRFAGCAKDQNRLIRLEPMLHVHLQSRERCRIFASHQALTPRRNPPTRGITAVPIPRFPALAVFGRRAVGLDHGGRRPKTCTQAGIAREIKPLAIGATHW